jgi:hypothetical protein
VKAPERSRPRWPVALLITGALVLLMVVFVAAYPDDGTGNGTPRSEPRAPRIVERPEEGRAPEQPGDPGGSQQLALLGLVVAGIGTMTLLVWRSSRRARSRSS